MTLRDFRGNVATERIERNRLGLNRLNDPGSERLPLLVIEARNAANPRRISDARIAPKVRRKASLQVGDGV